MNDIDILSLLKKHKSDFKSLIKELNIVTNKDEEKLKVILNELLDEAKIGLIDSKYFLMPNDLFLGKVINKKRNAVSIELIPSKDILDISGDESRTLLINDYIYIRKILGSYHPVEYYKSVSHLRGRYSLTSKGESRLIVDYLDKCGISVVISSINNFKLSEGDLLECEINNYKNSTYYVDIRNILVKASELGSDITMLVAAKEIPLEFPKKVLDEARSIPASLLESDYQGRLDLRNEVIFTIDGVDSRDFDDAISIKVSNNGYEIGVHIADVTSYVKEAHPLDDEAYKRGTSIYLADRVIPMLPVELSNGICSLNPKVDRLAVSVFMNVDAQGNIFRSNIYLSVINSYARLNYDEVNLFFHRKKEIKDKKLAESLNMLNIASKLIRKRRKRNGSIDIETTELKFTLNEDNEPVSVKKIITSDAENMIEDLMVSANVEVAKKLKEAKIPVLYRIHEYPSKEKYELFKALIKKMDYTLYLNLPKYENITGNKLNDFILSIKDDNLKSIYSYLLLRAMSKARYSPEEKGHFGLGELYYCHFTSPIRRYPDIVIHNLIKDYLLSKKSFDNRYLTKYIDNMGKVTSDLEIRADMLEREVDDLESCKYMHRFLGKTFTGKIISFIKKGMFIELDNGIEGFLPFHLTNFESINYQIVKDTLISFKTKDKSYSFGSKMEVVVLSVNVDRKEITFSTKSFFDKYAYSLSEKERDDLVYLGVRIKDNNTRDYKILNERKNNNSSRKEYSRNKKRYNNHSRNFKGKRHEGKRKRRWKTYRYK